MDDDVRADDADVLYGRDAWLAADAGHRVVLSGAVSIALL